jgi:hypothetical protein
MKLLNIVINVANENNKWKELCLSCMHFWPKLESQRPHKRKNGFFLFPIIGVLVFGSFLILTQGSSYAAQVKLAWNASNGAAGYKIYYGTVSKNYTSFVDVKNNLTYTFPDLPDGNTYYFVATAYDTSRLESNYSAEVSYNAISGHPAVLWRNTSNGQVALWYMKGTDFIGTVSISVVSLDWTIVGRADFNSDSKPDIILRNTTTGQNAVYYMDGATILNGVNLPTIDPAWTLAGTGDFNSDGHPDILWRNAKTGQNILHYMNGLSVLSAADLPTANPTLKLAGIGDFNSDGHPDILWRNTSTGEIVLWYMNRATATGIASVGIIPLEWVVAGVFDFNSDGHPDILWRNTSTGVVAFSCMNGTTFIGDYYLPTVADQNWKIVG